MRACIVSPYSLSAVSGISAMVIGLARGITARGHIAYIAATHSSRVASALGLRAWELNSGKIFSNARLSLETARTIWRNRDLVDLVHLNQGHLQTVLGAAAARILGKPVIGTFHLRPPEARGTRGLIERFSIRMSLAICRTRVFVSVHTMESFRASGIVIKNGVDTEGVRQQLGDRHAIRNELGLDGPVVLFAGRLAKNKGFLDLLTAARRALDNGTQLTILTTGEASSDERGDIEREIGALGLGRHLVQLGNREDHLQYLAAADIFALPSHTEGLPMSLLEAMSAGLPILASNVGGIPEIITDGREGLLVRPRDIKALQAGLETLANRSDLRERLGSHALRKAESLDLSKTVTAYLDLYDHALGES